MKEINLYETFINSKSDIKYIQDILSEGLIISVDYELFYSKIEDYLFNNKIEFEIKYEYLDNFNKPIKTFIKDKQITSIHLKVDKININQYKNLLKLINMLGYYISSYYIDNLIHKGNLNINNFKNSFYLIINKKFDYDFTEKIDFLYYITSIKNLEKIKKIGLIPKNKNNIDNYTDKIYFLIKYDEDEFTYLANAKYNHYFKNNYLFIFN